MRTNTRPAMLLCLSLTLAAQAFPPTLTTIHNFTGNGANGSGCANCDGAVPSGGIVIGNGGVLYGTTEYGGSAGYGTVFSLTPPQTAGGAWTESILHNFSFADGTNPYGSLTIGTSGVLYGPAQYGGNANCAVQGQAQGCGTIFSLTPPASSGGAWTYAVLYVFSGSGDGAVPAPGPLEIDSSGVLYGTTNSGGPGTCIGGIFSGCGAVFSLAPPTTAGGPWTETVLTTASTLLSNAGVSGILFSSGVLYAAAYNSGDEATGLIFSISLPSPGGAWTESALYSFTNNERPSGSLALGNGLIYGAASSGTADAPVVQPQDEVYSLTPPATSGHAWTKTTLYNPPFDTLPPNSLTFSGGVLYGIILPQTCACGTLYSLTPPDASSGAGGMWTPVTLHDFTGGADGGNVNGGLVVGSDGTIYGTAQAGGSGGVGTVFSLKLVIPEPSLNPDGVVNGASFLSPVSPGSIASAFGSFFVPAPVGAIESPLPDNLSQLSLEFNASVPAPLFFASSGQVNFQVPWELSGQAQANLSTMLYSQASSAQTVTLAAFAPAIFATNAQGSGQGAILDAANRLVDSSNPATPSTTVLQIFCTGLGPLTNQPPTGSPAPLTPYSYTTTTPTVTIGGVQANVSFSGLAPGFVGLYQVNADVPVGVTAGSAVPVVISMPGTVSNTVTIAVQ